MPTAKGDNIPPAELDALKLERMAQEAPQTLADFRAATSYLDAVESALSVASGVIADAGRNLPEPEAESGLTSLNASGLRSITESGIAELNA